MALIAQIRVAESSLTLATYLAFDLLFGTKLVSLPALGLLPYLFIPVIIGVPLGTLLLTAVSPEFFRRFVMAVDVSSSRMGFPRLISGEVAHDRPKGNILLGILLARRRGPVVDFPESGNGRGFRLAGGGSTEAPRGCSRVQPRFPRRHPAEPRVVLAVEHPGPPVVGVSPLGRAEAVGGSDLGLSLLKRGDLTGSNLGWTDSGDSRVAAVPYLPSPAHRPAESQEPGPGCSIGASE